MQTVQQRFVFGALMMVAVSGASNLNAQPASPAPPVPAQPAVDVDQNLKSFDEVWQRIKQTHWDPEKVGAEWDAARDELRPQVARAENIEEARQIMQQLLERLGQSHFAIIPATSYELVGGDHGGDADVGLTIRYSDEEFLIVRVHPDSPAARAGIRPGWRVESIEQRDRDQILDRLRPAAKGPIRLETLVGLVLQQMMSGEEGKSLTLGLVDLDGQSVSRSLVLEPSPGKMATLGYLPPMRIQFESKTLDGHVGYFWFNAFLDPVTLMPAFRKTIRNPDHRGGMIIDLRGNIGGIAGMTMGMASLFSPQPQPLGTMTMRGTKLKFTVNANPKPYTGPVAILVDECSISSAEILAGGMQDLGLARVFGRRTAGLALPSIVTRLPNGDGFQYAMADYHSASGKSLEHDGVMPDEVVPLDPRQFATESDPTLARAIDWLEQQNQNQP